MSGPKIAAFVFCAGVSLCSLSLCMYEDGAFTPDPSSSVEADKPLTPQQEKDRKAYIAKLDADIELNKAQDLAACSNGYLNRCEKTPWDPKPETYDEYMRKAWKAVNGPDGDN